MEMGLEYHFVGLLVCVFRLFHRGLIKYKAKRHCVYNTSGRRVSVAVTL